MIKRFITKLLGSAQHSKHGRHRYSSSSGKKHYGHSRLSSSDRAYGHKNNGHSYYKSRKRSSS
ncbi:MULTISPECIES: hypothetical protein [Paenibacillus]|uniref:hypothetical protein n=1 Tax=Paenibacillus TaxID=44249 RepID=UPI00038F6682|nr:MULTISPECIES: hypothetical protein [Paenibacillus]CDN43179.1 hypothetical protein BN871_CN_00110 [Paenibacillus sp. P22]